jgi:hypothetical protein
MVVLGDDADELADTELLEGQLTPIGDIDHTSVDTNDTTLLRFDLSTVAASATVLSAQLTVKTFDQASTDGGTVLVHRMRESWSEASATFVMRNGNQAWMTDGAAPPSRDTAVIATLIPAAINTEYTVDLPVALVQDWVENASINFGIAIVRGTSTLHVHFRSRENSPNSRLTLMIQP